LFVHVPVVLIPLVGLGAIAMACSARARERYGWLVLTLAVVAGISTQLAIGSGEELRDSVAKSAALRRHVNIASSIRPLILLLFLVALAIMLVDCRARGAWPFSRVGARSSFGSWTRAGVIAVTLVVAVGTNVRLFQIGDSGAKATWQRVHIDSDRSRDRSGPG
jgi:hypothetical protein